MSRQIKYLLAGKFGLQVLQLFLTFLVIIKRQDNINASKYSSSQTATGSLTACIVLTLFCQFFNLVSLLTGTSVFFDRINVFSITLQGIGALFTSWFVLGQWPSELLWPIWVFGTLIPFILELFIFLIGKKVYSNPIILELS
jgi:Transmembrane protein